MDGRERKVTIGRDPNCEVPLADPSVSRLHAELVVAPSGALELRDCGSGNGTVLVRGAARRRIADREPVYATDRLQLGNVTLEVAEVLSRAGIVRGAATTTPEAAAGASAPASTPSPRRMVRCACGTVKPAGERCPVCFV
jgi:pSer/pThr/pTyr-binding forkhead associated (FHA) protein